VDAFGTHFVKAGKSAQSSIRLNRLGVFFEPLDLSLEIIDLHLQLKLEFVFFFRSHGLGMLVTGYWILDTGHWVLGAGYWVRVIKVRNGQAGVIVLLLSSTQHLVSSNTLYIVASSSFLYFASA